MATLQNTKPLSSRTVEMMKPGDKIKADTGENTGLWVKCGATGVKTFFYRYTSPITSKSSNGRIIAGARKPKGQSETRGTLYGDAIPKLGICPQMLSRERQLWI